MRGVRQQFKSLGALLMEKGLLGQAQLDAALDEQKRTGDKLGRILVQRGWVREKDIITVLQGMMVVVFQAGGESYGVETLLVREIIRHERARPVPACPEWLEGVLDYRGKVIPVVDLMRRLGKPEAELESTARIIVYESTAGRAWGLHVESVSAVVHVNRDHLEDVVDSGSENALPSRWVAGVARMEGSNVTLLNVEEMLAASEPEAHDAMSAGGLF